MSTKMNNETEFILSPDLTKGFTVLSNEVYDFLSDGAVGLYGRIIMRANIPGWKVYQSTLINDLNKKAAVVKSMNELISVGYIEKMQIRNEKGQIKGIKYVVHSKPIKKIDNVESVENTDVQPKAEKPISVKPTSVKRPLINKDTNKIKNLKKKDITTTKEKANTEKNNSSSSLNINLDIKGITKTNIKRLNLNQEQIDLLENYVAISEYENLDKFCYYIAKQIKNELITEKDLAISKKVSKKKNGTGLSPYFEKDKEYYEKAAKEFEEEAFNWDLNI